MGIGMGWKQKEKRIGNRRKKFSVGGYFGMNYRNM
jgi:hypothetical protein